MEKKLKVQSLKVQSLMRGGKNRILDDGFGMENKQEYMPKPVQPVKIIIILKSYFEVIVVIFSFLTDARIATALWQR